MLLTRLAEHASRAEGLPPPFYRIRPVRWAIRLQADGTPAAFTLADLAGSDQPAGQPLAVPYIYRSGRRPPADAAWPMTCGTSPASPDRRFRTGTCRRRPQESGLHRAGEPVAGQRP